MNIGPNTTLHLILGPSGVGKSWICRQLAARACVVKWDEIREWPFRDAAIEAATHQAKPILVEVPVNVGSTINRYAAWAKWVGFVAVAPPAEIVRRRLKRQADAGTFRKIHTDEDAIRRRIQRLVNVAALRDFFVGTARECLMEIEAAMRARATGYDFAAGTAQFYVYDIVERTPAGALVAYHYVGKGYDNHQTGYSRRLFEQILDDRFCRGTRLWDAKQGVLARGNQWLVEHTVAADEADAFRREAARIAELRAQGWALLNRSSGGCEGWTHSAQTKAKISQRIREVMATPEVKAKMLAGMRRAYDDPVRGPLIRAAKVAWQLGRKMSDEARKRMAEAAQLRAASPWWRAHQSGFMTQRHADLKAAGQNKLSFEHRAKISAAVRRPYQTKVTAHEWQLIYELRGAVAPPYPVGKRNQSLLLTESEKVALLRWRQIARV